MLVISKKEKKWTNGEKYEKSYKNQKPIFNSNNKIIDNVIENKINSSKRNEINNEKIQNRELISHTYQNPFLNKNYIDVLDDQTNFLIPKNSNNLED
tara:strand:+ start:80 stop:370 length:291 start_codon:yes stop_codon:yes gene_type:complete